MSPVHFNMYLREQSALHHLSLLGGAHSIQHRQTNHLSFLAGKHKHLSAPRSATFLARNAPASSLLDV